MNKNTITINKIKVKIFLAISFTLLTLVAAPIAGAEEIVIMDNGANSTSEVNSNQNNQSNTQQSNNAVINNNVTSTTDTGNNAANNTTGDTLINTGTASQATNITNETNKSIVDQTCCANLSSTSVNIIGNGVGSQNNATNVTSSQTIISVIQNATVINNIKETASTGNNSANNNTGNVSIHSGDIVSTKNVINSVNSTKVSIPNNSQDNTNIKISNNGLASENNSVLEKNKFSKISANNSANIKNEIASIFETGNNSAEGNIGTIDIRTGDIKAKTTIQNDININKVDIICCNPKQMEEKPIKPQPQPTPNIPPTQPTPNNPTISPPSGPSNPTTQIGQVAGVALSTLPTTGNNWLFFSLLGNIIMLFLGAYLRLRSGNSPGTLAFTSKKTAGICRLFY